MKILIVNTYDIVGGAARAAYRLHRALLNAGVDSQMLVLYKRSDDETVIGPQGKIGNVLALARIFLSRLPNIIKNKFFSLLRKHKTREVFDSSWLPFSHIVNKINEINPDIVHLHWISDGLMRIEDIARIRAPIVWSLHDNWAFSGGCHIMWECTRYREICGRCPRLGSSRENDLSRRVFNRKDKTFSKIENITIVGLSHWLYNCSLSSALLKDKHHVNIPNPLNTSIFKPYDKKSSRKFWKLPTEKKLILFGAIGATSDINKGFKELSQALKKLDKNQDVAFVVFGSDKPFDAPDFGFNTHYLGKVHGDEILAKLYSAVDVMVVPSLQEAFGQTASEAMSCGIPTVAFAHTGLLDIVDHKQNGYLAQPYESDDLKDGIEWVLNAKNYDDLCQSARAKVLNNFDSVEVAKRYIDLYHNIFRNMLQKN